MMLPYTPQQPPRLEVVQFGNWIKRQLFIETSEQRQNDIISILNPRERPLIKERLLQGKADIEDAYRQRLELGYDFYVGVRQHLMAILQVWDAVLDQKYAFDELGCSTWNREFIESFLLCTDMIPTRVSVGSLGPPGVLGSSNDYGGIGTEWNGQGSRQSHNTDVLALSDHSVDDTTTDEEDEGVKFNFDGKYSNYDEEDEEEEEDDEEFEDIPPPPPTPYPAPMNIPEAWRLFPEDEPEDWNPDLQNLIDKTSGSIKSELSDLEEFTPSTGQHTSASKGPHAWADHVGSLHTTVRVAKPIFERRQRCESQKPVTSKKRRLHSISGPEDLDGAKTSLKRRRT